MKPDRWTTTPDRIQQAGSRTREGITTGTDNEIPGAIDPARTPSVTIASYLQGLLAQYEASEFIKYLIAPSPTALANVFGCEARDVREALQELERQGYKTEVRNDTDTVTLWDPLIRDGTIRHMTL